MVSGAPPGAWNDEDDPAMPPRPLRSIPPSLTGGAVAGAGAPPAAPAPAVGAAAPALALARNDDGDEAIPPRPTASTPPSLGPANVGGPPAAEGPPVRCGIRNLAGPPAIVDGRRPSMSIFSSPSFRSPAMRSSASFSCSSVSRCTGCAPRATRRCTARLPAVAWRWRSCAGESRPARAAGTIDDNEGAAAWATGCAASWPDDCWGCTRCRPGMGAAFSGERRAESSTTIDRTHSGEADGLPAVFEPTALSAIGRA